MKISHWLSLTTSIIICALLITCTITPTTATAKENSGSELCGACIIDDNGHKVYPCPTFIPIHTISPTTILKKQSFFEKPTGSYSKQFLNSKHFAEKTQQINGYTYYKTKPNVVTISDYIATQKPLLLNNPNSEIYISIKDHGWFINREVIAYSRTISPNDTLFSLHKNPYNPERLDLLVAISSDTKNPVGVFMDPCMAITICKELPDKFEWISTWKSGFIHLENKIIDITDKENGWIDTIYAI